MNAGEQGKIKKKKKKTLGLSMFFVLTKKKNFFLTMVFFYDCLRIRCIGEAFLGFVQNFTTCRSSFEYITVSGTHVSWTLFLNFLLTRPMPSSTLVMS